MTSLLTRAGSGLASAGPAAPSFPAHTPYLLRLSGSGFIGIMPPFRLHSQQQSLSAYWDKQQSGSSSVSGPSSLRQLDGMRTRASSMSSFLTERCLVSMTPPPPGAGADSMRHEADCHDPQQGLNNTPELGLGFDAPASVDHRLLMPSTLGIMLQR